jgi:hypothetical protein
VLVLEFGHLFLNHFGEGRLPLHGRTGLCLRLRRQVLCRSRSILS